jgi:hypothetical protein
VRQCSGGEAADSSVKKLLILIELNNMVAGTSVVKETSPWLEIFSFAPIPFGEVVGCLGTVRLVPRVALKRVHSHPPHCRNGSFCSGKNSIS